MAFIFVSNSKILPHKNYIIGPDKERLGLTAEYIKRINEEREKGITFLDKWGDKITLVDEDIACSFSTKLDEPHIFTPVNSILYFLISEGDILNIRTEKGNAVVWGRDISYTYLFTFLIELDPL